MIVQVPAATNANTPPLVIVQTPEVDEVNETGSPEVDVAVTVGVVPKYCVTGVVNVIDCVLKGVVELDAPEAMPVPTLLVAVTVKV